MRAVHTLGHKGVHDVCKYCEKEVAQNHNKLQYGRMKLIKKEQKHMGTEDDAGRGVLMHATTQGYKMDKYCWNSNTGRGKRMWRFSYHCVDELGLI
jgi:hypothetical protein